MGEKKSATTLFKWRDTFGVSSKIITNEIYLWTVNFRAKKSNRLYDVYCKLLLKIIVLFDH